MSLAELVPLVIRGSIFLTVFTLGLGARASDMVHLLGRPGLLGRAVLSMAVVMPLVAVGLAEVFGLYPAIKIALVALALSPVPPILPNKLIKAGGSLSFVVGLLVTAAVVSIVFIPLAVYVLGWVFGLPGKIPLSLVARMAMITVVVPLLLGIVLRRLAPALAARIAGPLGTAGLLLLVLAALPVLIGSWRDIVSLIGNGSILAFAAFVVIGLVVGHVLGGPDPDERSALALTTACRHPGIAVAVAHAAFPTQPLLLPAVALYLLVSAVLTIPYVVQRHRVHDRLPAR